MSDAKIPKIALIAALPREMRGLVGRARVDETYRRQGIHLYRLPSAVVVSGGMGAARASLAVQAALAVSQPAEVISIGLAGACSAALAPGEIAEAALVIDPRTGERFGTGRDGVVLASTDTIASLQEKARLAETYGAAMVDMEAATVARLARANGIGFRAIKGISDAHDFELEALSRFAGKNGEFRTAAFAVHTALRPGTWAAAAHLGRNSHRALDALHLRLREIFAIQE